MSPHPVFTENVIEVSMEHQDTILEALPDLEVLRWIIRNPYAVAEVLAPGSALEKGKKWWRVGAERETHCHVDFEPATAIRFIEKIPQDGGPGSRSFQWIGPDGEPFLKVFLVKEEGVFVPRHLALFEDLRGRCAPGDVA